MTNKVSDLIALLSSQEKPFTDEVTPTDAVIDLAYSYAKTLTSQEARAVIRHYGMRTILNSMWSDLHEIGGKSDIPDGRYSVFGHTFHLKSREWFQEVYDNDRLVCYYDGNVLIIPGNRQVVTLTKIGLALTVINQDPSSVSREYGHQTGHCGVCGRVLSDPESVALGIGPVCAKQRGWL